MLKLIDNLLDRITMYRLLVYYLIAILLTAVGLSMVNVLSYSPAAIIISTLYLVIIAWLTDKVFSYIFNVPANSESSLITALILALLINPLSNTHNALFLTAAAGLAIASKYVLAINNMHVFNPAAVAVVLTSLGPQQTASWWVGTKTLLPVVVIGGLLVARKIRHIQMVGLFVVTAIVTTMIVSLQGDGTVIDSVQKLLLHSSLFFLGFVMLTEPLTAPSAKRHQYIFAVLVGVLFSPQVHIGGFYTTPELALVLGNVYAFWVSPRYRQLLGLQEKIPTGPQTGDFVFELAKPISYKPGQYMEFTVNNSSSDSRGNRRTFTLASSPTEDNLRIGVKFYPNGSAYKNTLLHLQKGDTVAAGQLAGDFTLPNDTSKKLAFIAGGIGITPFRSMTKYMLDAGEKRDVSLLYSEKHPAAFVYKDVFDTASSRGQIAVTYAVSDDAGVPPGWNGELGTINGTMITRVMPDYLERMFYVSGPHIMVEAMTATLHSLGVPRRHIKTDHFSGYA
jgi:ferredoxin-NADP reductase/Na+-translocating ferredoxin:NAD+ oxidoreductase RnfD subunit